MSIAEHCIERADRPAGSWTASAGMLLLVFCCVFLPACGKKAPPVAPRQVQQPAVQDLSKRIRGDRLTLTWTAPAQMDPHQAGLSGFSVYKSMRKVSEPECRSCPLIFKRVAVIPIQRAVGRQAAENLVDFTDTLEKGYRYHYKVTTNLAGGGSGKDSNTIAFQY